jgi:hypothetical protein
VLPPTNAIDVATLPASPETPPSATPLPMFKTLPSSRYGSVAWIRCGAPPALGVQTMMSMATLPAAPALQDAGGVKMKVPPIWPAPEAPCEIAVSTYSPDAAHTVSWALAGDAKARSPLMAAAIVKVRIAASTMAQGGRAALQ